MGEPINGIVHRPPEMKKVFLSESLGKNSHSLLKLCQYIYTNAQRLNISIKDRVASNNNPNGRRCITLRISLTISFSGNGYSLTLIGSRLDGTN